MSLLGQLVYAFASAMATTSTETESGHGWMSGREQGPPIVPGTTVYRSRDGTTHFRFRLERQPDRSLRVYIVEQPGYRGRPRDGHTTHRYLDGDGRRFICWSEPLRTIGECLGVAGEWSERTLRYARYGTPFEETMQ